MGISITDILGGSAVSAVKDIISQFHASPEDKMKMQEAVDANATVLATKQLEYQGKLQDAISSEVQSSAEIIKAEAGSQSWLPRNVRPLLLLVWGSAIGFNALVPIFGQFVSTTVHPVALDPWVYKLTAIGYTGYVGFRTWEKLKDSDN